MLIYKKRFVHCGQTLGCYRCKMARQVEIRLEDLGVVVTEDIKKTFEDIEIEAGVLQEQFYKNGTSLQKVASILEAKYGWLEKGLTTGKNSDLRRAVNIVVQGLAQGHFTEQQFLNAVAATMVNPINRKEFGSNAPSTVKAKGFDKVMVHTGRFIKSIKARLERG